MKEEKAVGEDVSRYARKLGELASESLCAYLTEEKLQDGKLYWNIIIRTVKPIMEKVHRLVNEAAIAVQKAEDKKSGIGIKPIAPKFPTERADAILNKLADLAIQEGE